MISKNKLNNKLGELNLEFEALEDIDSQNSENQFLCKKCNKIFIGRWASIRVGDKKCPHCSSNKWTNEKFKAFVTNTTKGEYQVLGEFVKNVKEKVEFYHTVCGNRYLTTPNIFISGYRCPHCSKSKKWNDESFRKYVDEHGNGDYTYTGVISGVHNKIEFIHISKDHSFYMRPENFIQGQRCPICRKNRTLDLNTSNDIVNSLDNNYIVTKYTPIRKDDC